jgi:hypothetical protein
MEVEFNMIELKIEWLHSEWDSRDDFFNRPVRAWFPIHRLLLPENYNLLKGTPVLSRAVADCFSQVRGNFSLWGLPRETGTWRKFTHTALKLDWVLNRVDILYPAEDKFNPESVQLVCWFDPDHSSGLPNLKDTNKNKPFKLIDGNHRVSAWKDTNAATKPAVFYIGGHPGVLPKDIEDAINNFEV